MFYMYTLLEARISNRVKRFQSNFSKSNLNSRKILNSFVRRLFEQKMNKKQTTYGFSNPIKNSKTNRSFYFHRLHVFPLTAFFLTKLIWQMYKKWTKSVLVAAASLFNRLHHLSAQLEWKRRLVFSLLIPISNNTCIAQIYHFSLVKYKHAEINEWSCLSSVYSLISLFLLLSNNFLCFLVRCQSASCTVVDSFGRRTERKNVDNDNDGNNNRKKPTWMECELQGAAKIRSNIVRYKSLN